MEDGSGPLNVNIPAHKREQLATFLGGLPNATAAKLFGALEFGRVKGSDDLPYHDLLTDLRKRLLERGADLPSRPLTAQRVFFAPFEDLFIARHFGRKRIARIARTSLTPIWRLMMTDGALTEAALSAANLDEALRAGGNTEQQERSLFMAAEVGFGRLCGRAEEDYSFRDYMLTELGDENVYADLVELRDLIPGVRHLAKLRDAIPSASPPLTEEQYYELRTMFLAAHAESPQIASYLLLALKGRLEKPWRALGVYYHLAAGADDEMLAARDAVAMLPDSLFEDIETMARALETDGAHHLDAETALLRIDYFCEYADGLIRHATRAGDNVFVNRVEACREIVVEAHDRFGEQALSLIRSVMPVRHTGGASRLRSMRPDIGQIVSVNDADQARAAATLLEKASANAERLGADPAFIASISTEAAQTINTYANDLVVEIRAAEGRERKVARRMLDQILKIAEPLIDADAIADLRNRAAAAAVTA